jgi:hypothetical protein
MLLRSVRTALEQSIRDVEIFIIGDGVTDVARDIVAELIQDPRVRFFDRPKGPRVGEHYRHAILDEARGDIVCYLSDDDLWLPRHVETLAKLLEQADFAHSLPVQVEPGGALRSLTIDLALRQYRELILAGINRIPLSTAGHTLAMYRRLPHGWRTTPDGIPTDLYMWQQFLADPGCRALSGTRPTALGFPSPPRRDWSMEQRLAEMDRWIEKLRKPGFLPGVLDVVAQERAAAANELQGLLDERTNWAQQSASDVVKRDAAIAELQSRLTELTTWAQHSAADVAERDARIGELQAELARQVAWAESSVGDVVKRDVAIAELQSRLAEQTTWAQLSASDVDERDARIGELQAELAGQAAWAESMVGNVAERDATIAELQRRLEEQTTWAQHSASDVAERDTQIGELQAELGRQAAWADSLAEDVVQRDAAIAELQSRLAEQTSWAQHSAADVAERDEVIRGLQARLDTQTAWGQRLTRDIAKRDRTIRELQAQIKEQAIR